MVSSLLLLFGLLGFSFATTISPLSCLDSSCDFEVPFNNDTLVLPDTCNETIVSESCSMTVSLIYLTNTVGIQFGTTPTDDTLQIQTVLPRTEEMGTVLQYHCNSKSFCEWDYLNKIYHQFLDFNFTSLLEVLTPENDFVLPPLSEAANLTCIVNGSELLCERGRCEAQTFPYDLQTWEGSCSERSDFDQSTFKLDIVTQYKDVASPYFDSFFTYQCYWNVCNTFEMVERIRTTIETDYEAQLFSLVSATTTTTTTTTIVTAAVTNRSLSTSTSTTTQMNNGRTNTRIEYHVLLLSILSFAMTFSHALY